MSDATITAPQPPAATDIAIPEPPPRPDGGEFDNDELYRHLARQSKAGQFNATLERQARAVLLSLYGATLDGSALAKNATAISSPPTQAQVQSVQTTVNAAIDRINALSTLLAAFVAAVNADLKSLPATAQQQQQP